jgi:hypothetical protein
VRQLAKQKVLLDDCEREIAADETAVDNYTKSLASGRQTAEQAICGTGLVEQLLARVQKGLEQRKCRKAWLEETIQVLEGGIAVDKSRSS